MRCSSRYILLVVFLIGFLSPAAAQPATYPQPSPTANSLFYLQRTHNSNTIVYDLNYSDGELDEDEPVHVYWIRYQEKGQKEELSFIQRKFAYGVKTKKLSNASFELDFVAYKREKMYLKKGSDARFHVFTTINKKQSILTKIYLHMGKGGSFWAPKIEYAELTGIDPETKLPVQERVKI